MTMMERAVSQGVSNGLSGATGGGIPFGTTQPSSFITGPSRDPMQGGQGSSTFFNMAMGIASLFPQFRNFTGGMPAPIFGPGVSNVEMSGVQRVIRDHAGTVNPYDAIGGRVGATMGNIGAMIGGDTGKAIGGVTGELLGGSLQDPFGLSTMLRETFMGLPMVSRAIGGNFGELSRMTQQQRMRLVDPEDYLSSFSIPKQVEAVKQADEFTQMLTTATRKGDTAAYDPSVTRGFDVQDLGSAFMSFRAMGSGITDIDITDIDKIKGSAGEIAKILEVMRSLSEPGSSVNEMVMNLSKFTGGGFASMKGVDITSSLNNVRSMAMLYNIPEKDMFSRVMESQSVLSAGMGVREGGYATGEFASGYVTRGLSKSLASGEMDFLSLERARRQQTALGAITMDSTLGKHLANIMYHKESGFVSEEDFSEIEKVFETGNESDIQRILGQTYDGMRGASADQIKDPNYMRWIRENTSIPGAGRVRDIAATGIENEMDLRIQDQQLSDAYETTRSMMRASRTMDRGDFKEKVTTGSIQEAIKGVEDAEIRELLGDQYDRFTAEGDTPFQIKYKLESLVNAVAPNEAKDFAKTYNRAYQEGSVEEYLDVSTDQIYRDAASETLRSLDVEGKERRELEKQIKDMDSGEIESLMTGRGGNSDLVFQRILEQKKVDIEDIRRKRASHNLLKQLDTADIAPIDAIESAHDILSEIEGGASMKEVRGLLDEKGLSEFFDDDLGREEIKAKLGTMRGLIEPTLAATREYGVSDFFEAMGKGDPGVSAALKELRAFHDKTTKAGEHTGRYYTPEALAWRFFGEDEYEGSQKEHVKELLTEGGIIKPKPVKSDFTVSGEEGYDEKAYKAAQKEYEDYSSTRDIDATIDNYLDLFEKLKGELGESVEDLKDVGVKDTSKDKKGKTEGEEAEIQTVKLEEGTIAFPNEFKITGTLDQTGGLDGYANVVDRMRQQAAELSQGQESERSK